MRTSTICTAANFSKALRLVSPRGEGFQLSPQRDVQAIGEEGDEHVRLDPLHALMEDWTDYQIAFQRAEGFFDLHQLQVVASQLHRIGLGEVGAQ